MKVIQLSISAVFLVLLLVPFRAVGQVTLYVSNIDQPSTGGSAIGSDLWIAHAFNTGTNPDGYYLDSVELLTMPASGDPSGFSVSVYTSSAPNRFSPPGTIIGGLIGVDPEIGGAFRYDASSLPLAPSTIYFLVVSSDTPTSEGAFHLDTVATGRTSGLEGWVIENYYYNSIDGLNWQTAREFSPKIGIYATPVPEPAAYALIFGGLALAGALIRRRMRCKGRS
jgi:hypothetical protein